MAADAVMFGDSPVLTNPVDDLKTLETWKNTWDEIQPKSGEEEPPAAPVAPRLDYQ